MDLVPDLSKTLLSLVGAGVLVFLNALFVAAEFAVVKVRKTRLQELAGQGISQARVSLLCVNELDETLSATQLGITLVSTARDTFKTGSDLTMIHWCCWATCCRGMRGSVMATEFWMHGIEQG